MITITKKAIPYLKKILKDKKYLLFGAKGGGCNGFEYSLTPTDTVNKLDHPIDCGLPMFVCGHSGFLVIGTEIDWREDVMGQRFEFTNPSASGTCGCGATFSSEKKI
jgi:iron-sulfur cluster assembly accessory protein